MSGQRHSYRYFDLIAVGFVTVLLCANFFGPAKTGTVAGWTFGIGNIFFPISYVFGDVLTEVYGYARARRVVWSGFAAMVFAVAMIQLVLWIPAADSEFNEQLQPALELVFDNSWRIVVASILGFVVGDLLNSYVLARMKVWTKGKHLWTRTIGSTVVGQGADTLIFYPIAFAGIWTGATLWEVMVANFVIKVGVEALMTPFTYFVVNTLKRGEQVDVFDDNTDFTPFSMRV